MSVAEWTFAQTSPDQQLAQLHHFSILKKQDGREVEFVIRVKEYLTPREPTMKFFAEADKQTNQKVMPYTPCGWGRTLLDALSECIRAIERFPYHG